MENFSSAHPCKSKHLIHEAGPKSENFGGLNLHLSCIAPKALVLEHRTSLRHCASVQFSSHFQSRVRVRLPKKNPRLLWHCQGGISLGPWSWTPRWRGVIFGVVPHKDENVLKHVFGVAFFKKKYVFFYHLRQRHNFFCQFFCYWNYRSCMWRSKQPRFMVDFLAPSWVPRNLASSLSHTATIHTPGMEISVSLWHLALHKRLGINPFAKASDDVAELFFEKNKKMFFILWSPPSPRCQACHHRAAGRGPAGVHADARGGPPPQG